MYGCVLLAFFSFLFFSFCGSEVFLCYCGFGSEKGDGILGLVGRRGGENLISAYVEKHGSWGGGGACEGRIGLYIYVFLGGLYLSSI
jgi:hypothetical protein